MPRKTALDRELTDMLVDIFQDAGARFTPHDVERLLRHTQ